MGRAKDDFVGEKSVPVLGPFFLPPARPHLPVWCGAGARPAAASAPQLDQVSSHEGTCNADSTAGRQTSGIYNFPAKI